MKSTAAIRRAGMLLLGFLILAMFVPAHAGTRKVINLTIGSGHPANTVAYTSTCQSFFQKKVSERAAAETEYDVTWTEGYGGTIAKLAEGLVACQDGILDLLVNTYSFDNKKLYLMNMPFYVPFSSPDPVLEGKACRAVFDKFKDAYEGLWASYNQKFLAFAPTGRYELNSNFPVKVMTDLKGHKVAAAGANLPWLEGSGAIPVQSNLNEAYTSLQTGVYDGWIMFPDSTYRFKMHEVARHYTLIGFGSKGIQGLSINLDVWNGLPPEIQKIIEEVAAEYEIMSAETARDWDLIAMDKMRAEGCTVTTLDPAESEKWVMGLPEIPQERADEAVTMGYPGIGIWNAYMEAQEALGYKFPRRWVVK